MAAWEGRKSPDSCGSAAGTGLSESPLTSGGSSRSRTEPVVVTEEEGEDGTGREGEKGRTETERWSGGVEAGGMRETEAEKGRTADTKTGAGTGTGGDTCISTSSHQEE